MTAQPPLPESRIDFEKNGATRFENIYYFSIDIGASYITAGTYGRYPLIFHILRLRYTPDVLEAANRYDRVIATARRRRTRVLIIIMYC